MQSICQCFRHHRFAQEDYFESYTAIQPWYTIEANDGETRKADSYLDAQPCTGKLCGTLLPWKWCPTTTQRSQKKTEPVPVNEGIQHRAAKKFDLSAQGNQSLQQVRTRYIDWRSVKHHGEAIRSHSLPKGHYQLVVQSRPKLLLGRLFDRTMSREHSGTYLSNWSISLGLKACIECSALVRNNLLARAHELDVCDWRYELT